VDEADARDGSHGDAPGRPGIRCTAGVGCEQHVASEADGTCRRDGEEDKLDSKDACCQVPRSSVYSL